LEQCVVVLLQLPQRILIARCQAAHRAQLLQQAVRRAEQRERQKPRGNNSRRLRARLACNAPADAAVCVLCAVRVPDLGGAAPVAAAAGAPDVSMLADLGLLLDGDDATDAAATKAQEHGRTPLHIVAHHGTAAQLRAVLDAAKAAGSMHLLQALFARTHRRNTGAGAGTGAGTGRTGRTGTTTGAGRTPLHLAAMKGRHEAVEELLQAARDAGGSAVQNIVQLQDEDKKTALIYAAAAQSSAEAVCDALLGALHASGGDDAVKTALQAVDNEQKTALFHAAEALHGAAACKTLLRAAAKDADVLAAALNFEGPHGRTACVRSRQLACLLSANFASFICRRRLSHSALLIFPVAPAGCTPQRLKGTSRLQRRC
jgi:hypothetical protein